MDWLKSWFPKSSPKGSQQTSRNSNGPGFQNVTPSPQGPASSHSQTFPSPGSLSSVFDSNGSINHPTNDVTPTTIGSSVSALKISPAPKKIGYQPVGQSGKKRPKLDSRISPKNLIDSDIREEEAQSADEDVSVTDNLGIYWMKCWTDCRCQSESQKTEKRE